MKRPLSPSSAPFNRLLVSMCHQGRYPFVSDGPPARPNPSQRPHPGGHPQTDPARKYHPYCTIGGLFELRGNPHAILYGEQGTLCHLRCGLCCPSTPSLKQSHPPELGKRITTKCGPIPDMGWGRFFCPQKPQKRGVKAVADEKSNSHRYMVTFAKAR